MKINGESVITEPMRPGGPTPNQRSGSTGNFSDILAQQVEKHTPHAAPGSEPTVEPGNSTARLPQVWHEVSGVLDSLEAYGRALGDSEVSLKDIEPLAADLESKVQSLQDRISQAPRGDLRGLAAQALTQAQTAALKFRRGDYV